MTFKKVVCLGVLAAALSAPIALPEMHGGIMDLVSSTLKKAPQQPPSIRILLTHDVPGVVIEVKGKYNIYDPNTNDQISRSFQGKRRYMQALVDGLRWGEEFPGIHQVKIVPRDASTTIIVDGVEYHGTIYVYDVGGSISVVNMINVEDYLNMILPQRYKDPMPEELLAAVAIVERTNCYYRMQNSKTAFWNVDAKKEGYGGYALSRPSRFIEQAVHKTQYMALQGLDGFLELGWLPESNAKRFRGVTYSTMTLQDADLLVKRGKNAAEILKTAFPMAALKLSYQPSMQ